MLENTISKIREKQALNGNNMLRNIGVIKYKYILYKAKEEESFLKEYAGSFDVIRTVDSHIYHITDEAISKAMYEVFKNKQFNVDDMPEEFKNITFVTIKRQKKVVFIICNSEIVRPSINALEKIERKELATKSHKLISWFCESFSSEDKKINVDYEKFFFKFFEDKKRFWDSLFGSIYLSESAYELDYGKIDNIVNSLLYFCNLNHYNVITFREDAKQDDKPFFKSLRHGIYIKECDCFGLHELPYNLLINLLRYIINEKCFGHPEEFFGESYSQNECFNQDVDMNILFEEKLFQENMQVVKENENFVIYTSRVNVNDNIMSRVLKIKDEDYFSKIQNKLEELVSEGLLERAEVIYSLKSDSHYLLDYEDLSRKKPLSQYIESVGKNSDKISELIILINDVFSAKASIRQKIFFDKDVSLLDILYINEIEQTLSFADISTLRFRREERYTTFQYPLCIMQVIDKFVAVNSIDTKDLYKYSFMKLFPKSFADELIQYIITKQYKAKGMIGKLKGILTKEDEICIEFLENISMDNDGVLQRITFLPQIQQNDRTKEIESRKTKVKSKFDNVECFSLDKNISYISKLNDLHLSNNLISRFFEKRFTTSAFLVPEKLIISKDIYDEKNYNVIGVIWNKSKLYKLSKLVKNKVINTQNIYNKIVNALIHLYEQGYYIDGLKDGIGSLLLDDDFNIVFNCASFERIGDVYKSDRNIHKYYNYIIKLVKNELDKNLDGMTYFTFNELVPESYNGMLNEGLKEAINNISFCSEHSKLYLFPGMCSDCKKIYFVDKTLYKSTYNHFSVFEDTIGAYFDYIRYDESATVWKPNAKISQSLQNRVRLGIENGLYDKYVALRPKKIIIEGYVNGKDKEAQGILYDDYDFSDIVELESFKHAQRLKVILVLYNKILPYIEDYSFIVSTKAIFTTMFMDKKYKGEIIIPNLSLLRCDISLSSDENLKKHAKEKTLKLFSEFLYEYIISDKALKLELENKDILISKIAWNVREGIFCGPDIKEYLASKDWLCKVHGIYFSGSDEICPECVVDGISKEHSVIFGKRYFDILKSQESQYEGGEANLYINSEGQIEKIFNDKVDHSFKSKVIGKALQKSKLFEEFNQKHENVKFVQISEVLYSHKNNVLNLKGYRQEFVPDSFKISSLKEKSFVDKLGYTREDIVEILINVCKGIEYLHSIGGFIGDLNGGNILIKDKVVYIIDMDGMSFDDVKNCVYTNMYIYPPSAENNNITALDDWYSFAVQAFYYLTYSHPFRGICENKSIPVNEVERMKLGYSVLGNHGIKIPNVSVGWSFMPKNIINFFLETFEGNKRENMIEILELYLKFIKENEMNFKRISRAHSVLREVSENIYIDTQGYVFYKEKLKFIVPVIGSDIDIQYDNHYYLISFSNLTYVIDNETGNVFCFNKSYENIQYVYSNRIYYTNESSSDIFVDEVDLETEAISTHILKRASDNEIIALSGDGIDKIVLLEDNEDDNTFDVYCNMIQICSLSRYELSEAVDTNIVHDEISDSWLILFICEDKTKGIVISKTGNWSKFTLNKQVSSSVSFYRNVLYYVDDRKIFGYNINTQKEKTIYCKEVTKDSGIDRVDNKFIISNEKDSYMYVKS